VFFALGVQGTVFFERVSKEQGPKTDISGLQARFFVPKRVFQKIEY
jgi:hypothetical protein